MDFKRIKVKLYTKEQRLDILNRSIHSAAAVGLTEEDIRLVINNFEYTGLESGKVGNIIKLICVLVEDKRIKKKNQNTKVEKGIIK